MNVVLQVESFFARLIQRVSPRSFAQAVGEVSVTQKFLEIFSGDQVQFEALIFKPSVIIISTRLEAAEDFRALRFRVQDDILSFRVYHMSYQ
jgi:hypothetical protein